MGKFDGKVVFITGAGRGQGRNHAIRFAEEGATIVATDICQDVASMPYPMSTEADLKATADAVREAGGKVLTAVVDVRDAGAVEAAYDAAMSEFGKVDIVIANAGVCNYAAAHEFSPESWKDMLDTNLTGVWHTFKYAVPQMIERGEGGVLLATSSGAGLVGVPNIGHYVAAKHGVQGLMKTMANEYGQHSIRVNTVNPTTVPTTVALNDATFRLFMPHLENPTLEGFKEASMGSLLLPIPWVEVDDISNAMMFLASDEGRYVTGVALPVDAGITIKF